MSSEAYGNEAGRRRRGGWLLLGLLGWTTVLQAGCYSVHPVADTALTPGTRLVATLTPQGSEQLASQVGPRVVALEGTLVGTQGQEWEVYVNTLVKRDSTEEHWNGERVVIPRLAIASLSERRLDRTRSYLAAAAITVGALLVARGFQSGLFLGGDGGGGENPPN
ncbi:MAG TPA: hypothetical protein VFX98_10275 [Longimicrobiaceae bacterium]|nr:hypothetical protein [Longimicrobiaceae bacterium]